MNSAQYAASAANWTRPWQILSICRLSRADFEPRGVIGTIRQRPFNFRLSWEISSRQLEKLKGNLKGFLSIRINDQWRVIFKWVDGDAYEVRVIDYH